MYRLINESYNTFFIVHDREELKEEQDEENDNEQYKQINKQNNNVASDDEEFEQQLRNAQIQAIQKQEEKLNALSSAYSQTNKEINEAGSSLIASQSTPHANIIEDTTNPTPQNKSKSKKGKKKRMVNNTVLNDEDAYKWQTELNFDDHEHHYQNGIFLNAKWLLSSFSYKYILIWFF